MRREALDFQMITRVIQMGALVSDEYFLDTETGEVVMVPEEVLAAVENDEAESLRPSLRALAEKAAEICSGNGRFVHVPHLSESDIFSVASKLAERLDDPEVSEAIAKAIASENFADSFDEICLFRPEVMDLFYKLLDEHISALIENWLREAGVISRLQP